MDTLFLLTFDAAGIQGKLITFTAEHKPAIVPSYFHHCHPYFEMHCITEGSCTLAIRDASYAIEAGSFCLIAPNQYHSIKSVSPDLKNICLGFELEPSSASSSEKASALAQAFSFSPCFMGSMAPVEGVLQQILNITAQAQPEFFTSEKLSALFSLLILELGQMAGFFSSSTEDRHITLDLKRNFLIDSFLNTHFQMRGGEQILADELHLSCRQLSRILTSLYGMGYREKVQEIRLAVSLDLLKHSSKSISEISELVGYDSPSSFCSFIKKSTGLTAGEIQKSARATSP